MITNIVLDIDETLIHSTLRRTKQTSFSIALAGQTYYVGIRPGLRNFLRFCFAHFATVNIWTAATSDYAYAIMSKILTADQKRRLKFFNTRGHMTHQAKRLIDLFNNPQARQLNITPSNTIIVDDKLEPSRFNLGNTIIIPAWQGSPSDRYLSKLQIVLEGLNQLDLQAGGAKPLFLQEIVS